MDIIKITTSIKKIKDFILTINALELENNKTNIEIVYTAILYMTPKPVLLNKL